MKKPNCIGVVICIIATACLLSPRALTGAIGDQKEVSFTLYSGDRHISYVVPVGSDLIIEYVGARGGLNSVTPEKLDQVDAVFGIACNPEPNWQGKPLSSFIFAGTREAIKDSWGIYAVNWTFSESVKLVIKSGTYLEVDLVIFGEYPIGVCYFTGHLVNTIK
jgi:hypothetical protein